MIINYHRFDDTIECLKSLDAHCKTGEISVLLIDNESSEPTARFAAAETGLDVTILQSPANIGFTGACNLGMRAAMANGSAYVFLLNNDAVLVDDVIATLKDALSADARLGIVGAVNYYQQSPERIWCAGIRTNRMTGRHFSVKEFDQTQSAVEHVDYVPGSSFMIKTALLREIGVFDDNYFAYVEEVDLCRRAQARGYEIGFVSNSRILHKVGASSPSKLKEYLRTRNTLYFLRRHSSPAVFAFAASLVVVRAGALSCLAFLQRKRALAASYVAAIIDFLRGRMGTPPTKLFHE